MVHVDSYPMATGREGEDGETDRKQSRALTLGQCVPGELPEVEDSKESLPSRYTAAIKKCKTNLHARIGKYVLHVLGNKTKSYMIAMLSIIPF